MITRFNLVFASLIGLVLSACAAVEPGRSVGRELDDFNASVALKSAMLRAEGYQLGGVDVEITEGVALLGGRVPRQEDRVYAACLAWSAQAVRSVANEIEVGDGRGPVGAARDAWITQQVRARLVSDRSIRSANYNIETQSSVVHLLGYARTSDERERAAAHAALIDGVERVVVLVRTGDEAADLPARGQHRAQMCEQAAADPASPA